MLQFTIVSDRIQGTIHTIPTCIRVFFVATSTTSDNLETSKMNSDPTYEFHFKS